jgi:hypothetical protein
MPPSAAILALLVGAAGWFYLFYSPAAGRLDGIESERVNRRRSGLRRFNGFVLIFLAVGFYVGFKLEPRMHPRLFIGIWIGVMILLVLTVFLAVIDLRLTARLRRKL